MMPSIIYETLAGSMDDLGVTADRIMEAESLDERPFDAGYFVVVSFGEELPAVAGLLAPRTMTIAVHYPWDKDRDYVPITRIINRVDQLLLPLELIKGQDGVQVSQIRRSGRSGNLSDEGWRTITRTATYGVSYDESAA